MRHSWIIARVTQADEHAELDTGVPLREYGKQFLDHWHPSPSAAKRSFTKADVDFDLWDILQRARANKIRESHEVAEMGVSTEAVIVPAIFVIT